MRPVVSTLELKVPALQRGLRVLEVPVTHGVRSAGVDRVSGNLAASLRAANRIETICG
jgi:hypothetical protein